jgi:hypothetical protein
MEGTGPTDRAVAKSGFGTHNQDLGHCDVRAQPSSVLNVFEANILVAATTHACVSYSSTRGILRGRVGRRVAAHHLGPRQRGWNRRGGQDGGPR